jgi:hypothetical protein
VLNARNCVNYDPRALTKANELEREQGTDIIPLTLPHVPTPTPRKAEAMVVERAKTKANVPIRVTLPTHSKTWNVATAGRRDTLLATATNVSMLLPNCLRTRPPSPNLLQLLPSSNMSPTSKEKQTNKRVMSRRIRTRTRTQP